MKTKRILAMLMAMCMLAACSMVVSAGEEAPTINYFSPDFDVSGKYPLVSLTLEKMKEGDEVELPGGLKSTSHYVPEDNSVELGKTHLRYVEFETNRNIPLQRYLISVWYKTDITDTAAIRLEYYGQAKSAKMGNKIFTLHLPSTNNEWKQYFLIWDATVDTVENDEGVWITDKDDKIIQWQEQVEEETVTKSQPFQGCKVVFMRQKGPKVAAGYTLEFCDPMMTPLTDISGVFTDNGVLNTATDSYNENKDTLGSGSIAYCNPLGVKTDSVVAGSEVSFKSTSTDLSVDGPTKVLLATYSENQLTGIQIVDATAMPAEKSAANEVVKGGFLKCTIPSDLSGEVKAFFWDSVSGLRPLAAPATVNVAAATPEA